MGFSVFKQTKNKRFDYTPRYYDERKERLRNLEEKYRQVSDDEYQSGYRRSNFRDSWKTKKAATSNTNLRVRLVVVLIFVLFLTYFVLKKYDILSLVYG